MTPPSTTPQLTVTPHLQKEKRISLRKGPLDFFYKQVGLTSGYYPLFLFAPTPAPTMIFGARHGLRGFRPRSETNYMNLFAVVLGVGTGVYIFSQPLQEAAEDVKKEKGGASCPGPAQASQPDSSSRP